MVNASQHQQDFYSGRYQLIVSTCVDGITAGWCIEDVPFVIGSLCFLGRINEALAIFRSESSRLTLVGILESKFYLAIATCRHNSGTASRLHLIESARLLRRASSSERQSAEFFVFQGIAFYRFIGGRLNRALYWSKKSYEAAFLQKFAYGKMLSLDVVGHCQVRTGSVRTGLQSLRMAEKLCEGLGHGNNLQAIRAAICLYRSYFGLSGSEDVRELDGCIEAAGDEDSYTGATLILEKARVLVSRGRAAEAKAAVDRACQLVYQVENPILEAELNHALGMWHYHRGEVHQALTMIQNALQRIGNTNDMITELKCRGCELMLLEKLKFPSEKIEAVRIKVRALTIRSGVVTAMRMLSRRGADMSPTSDSHLMMVGQDPLGDIHDLIAQKRDSALQELLSTGYYGLLPQYLDLPHDFVGIVLGIEHSSVTLIDNGNVEHHSGGWPLLVIKLIDCLKDGPRSREEIVRATWGQPYNPTRHDSVLYGLVSRTRKLLGGRDRWLEVTESGYALSWNIKVRIIAKTKPNAKSENVKVPITAGSMLNLRQLKIMSILEESGTITTKMICHRLRIPEVTASRDLSTLSRLGRIERQGRGRAVNYVRSPDAEVIN